MHTFKDSRNSDSNLNKNDFFPRVKTEDMNLPRSKKRKHVPREVKMLAAEVEARRLFHEQNPGKAYTLDIPMNHELEIEREFEAKFE